MKTGRVRQGRESSNITCTNGFGAKFYYENTHSNIDYYSINYLEKELFSNIKDSSWADFSWTTPVSRIRFDDVVNSVRKLNDKYSNYANGSFDFKLPMSVNDVRKYVTSDEKILNGKLKFLVTIKPIFPFYGESTYYSGERCGDKYNTGGSTSTSSGIKYHALFDIVSLKLIDSSNNKILLERKYSQ